ncbi:MAG: cytochrome ubiquinol oxidase subunit I, partial [Bifidobacteriales bacterium]|nr:cytochrome ubiquinol oxidase subunit I [Bifidobacteriales bacterium]
VVAEIGRQPWIIEGILPTAVAVSNLGVTTVFLTICGFVALYTALLVVEVRLMLKYIRKGPDVLNDHSEVQNNASATALS